jgi:hypothetical protein
MTRQSSATTAATGPASREVSKPTTARRNPSNSSNSSSSSSSSSSSRSKGHVDVTVFSLLDLPYDNKVPLGVRLSVCGTSVWTGPPKQRRLRPAAAAAAGQQTQNGNSFRFAATPSPPPTAMSPMGPSSSSSNGTNANTGGGAGSSASPFRLTAPLCDLYGAKLKVEVVYGAVDASEGTPTTLLYADVSLCKLCINRPQDLTVTLKHAITITIASTSTSTTSIVPELSDRPPTIAMRLHLQGPYRPQIQTVFHYVRVYLQLIDMGQDQFWDPIYKDIIRPYILPALPVGIGLSALPVVTTLVVVSPLVIGISILFFPIVIPLLVLIAAATGCGLGVIAVLCGSTRGGRTLIDSTLVQHEWVQQYVVTSPATQAFLYDTGGDWLPSPVALLRWYVVPDDVWIKLLLSLFVDCVGSCSYLLPVVGESFDGPWAPFQSMLLMAMYKDADQPHLKYVSFAEELLPFTDVLPTATIGWATENMPHLVQEWKDLYSSKGTTAAGGRSDVINKENNSSSSNNNNNSGDTRRHATSSLPFSGTTTSNKANKGFEPTPEQKRSILQEMQAHSERLSVQS